MKRDQNDHRKTVIILVMLFFCGVVTVANYSLQRIYDDAIQNGKSQAEIYTRSFENFVTQYFNITDIISTTLTQDISSPDNINTVRLFDAIIKKSPEIRSLNLLDPTNKVIISSESKNIGITYQAQSIYPLSNLITPTLQIGNPCKGRDLYSNTLCDDKIVDIIQPSIRYFIPVVKPLSYSKSGYKLLVMFNPDFFINYFAQSIQPSSGNVSIYRYDGINLLNSITDSDINSSDQNLFLKLDLSRQEIGLIHNQEDSKIISYRTSSLYPFIIITQLNTDPLLKNWLREKNSVYGTLAPTLCLLIVLSALYLHRQGLLLKQQKSMRRLEQINAASVFNHAIEGIAITNPLFMIEDVNESFSRITNIERPRALNQSFFELCLPNISSDKQAELLLSIQHTGYWYYEFFAHRADYTSYYAMLTVAAIRNEQQQIHQYILFLSDITPLKEYQQQLEAAAKLDPLTKLPNRRALYEKLSLAMAISEEMQTDYAVIFIDLDGFKSVNDNFGHDTGDQLLITLSKKIQHQLREHDIVARIGGDEFVAIINHLQNEGELIPLLSRLKTTAATPVTIDQHSVSVTVSMGVLICHGRANIDVLLKKADQLMYQAKQSGKNAWKIDNSAA